jgi:2-dehydro-3-deoxygalactonokinase
MHAAKNGWAVALDGGTTNTRARLCRDGRVVAVARRSVGVRDSVLAEGASALARAVREALGEVVAAAGAGSVESIVAAGMLSAEVGLASVPHVVAPAGVAELARGALLRDLPEVSDRPILFIPGVRTPPAAGTDGWAEADVMRGEECETIGAWSLLGQTRATDEPPGRAVFVWPGSHTKLVEVDEAGRIVRSHTSLAGELTQALARHTLLAASLPPELPDDPEAVAAAAGARLVARGGLGRAAFLVRIAALGGALDAHGRASFLVGAIIADDVAYLARHAMLADPGVVWVGGRQPQRGLYARMLGERLNAPVRELDQDWAEHASAVGALRVAEAFVRGAGSGVGGRSGPAEPAP